MSSIQIAASKGRGPRFNFLYLHHFTRDWFGLPRAEIISKKLLKENPKIVFLYNLLGLILSEQRKINEAISCYSKGIKVDPNYAMNYNNLGQLYFKHKPNLFQKVEIFYKKSISLDKKIPEPHVNLGNLYSFLNNYDEAIKYHKKAIETNPKFQYPYHGIRLCT